MAFFVKLKETCRQIDNDVNDIKIKMIGSHKDHDREEFISKKICHMQDKINTLKTDANDLKTMLERKLEHSRDFIKNIKELMSETEVSISNRQEYFKQFGYTPVEAVPQVLEIPVENNVTPDKKIREDHQLTPNLLDYGIPSYTLVTTPELNQKSSIENLNVPPGLIPTINPKKSYKDTDSTPTLDVAAIISTSKPNETPPFPETLHTPTKETPPFPEPFYTQAKEIRSLAYNSVNFPSTPKLNI